MGDRHAEQFGHALSSRADGLSRRPYRRCERWTPEAAELVAPSAPAGPTASSVVNASDSDDEVRRGVPQLIEDLSTALESDICMRQPAIRDGCCGSTLTSPEASASTDRLAAYRL